ncbi:glutamyl-tRNA reductase [Fluviispira multicolorata]|uniref:Glutamyl-tRNA reductase n=1 Tax=Fluviispira multicolorata TaxID=2654512 RepID=A0A833JEJ1_9BACT|nr:glutamyl-tRNA reductase [Fluviispira multicolorata]KAB8033239.1 glutamyl-tRNA reductase [Fluviispira multicolorata]
MKQSQFFAYSGAHFKTCPVEMREAWASVGSLDNIKYILQKISPLQTIEFVIISTCNRFDICFFGIISQHQIINIFSELLSVYNNNLNLISKSFSKDYIEKFLHIDFDADALRTLYKVTTSLDSLVLGESQILGQVKDAYLRACEFGSAQNQASAIFSRNFRVAKKVRTETEIGRNGISIGHAAIDVISRVFDGVQDKKIVIFGAGEMSRITAQHLIVSNAKSVYIANRTFAKAEKLALELGEAWPLELDDALQRISEFDICIAAASGNNFIIEKNHLKDYSKKRHGKLSVMVDISVPRKIDPTVSEFDNLFLFNVDDLDSVMEKNRQNRRMAAQQAEKIIEEEVRDFILFCKQKENLANVGRFHSWVKNVTDYELSRYIRDINNGKVVNQSVVSDAIAKKIVSNTALLARNNIKVDGDDNSVGDLLEFLFRLSEQPLLPENIQKEDNIVKLPIKPSAKAGGI